MTFDLLEVLKILGPTAGALVVVYYLLLNRYSKLVDTAIDETRKANELRVEDARKRAEQQDNTIKLLANLLTVVAETVKDTRGVADALQATAASLERQSLRRIAEERRLPDRGSSAERHTLPGGHDDP